MSCIVFRYVYFCLRYSCNSLSEWKLIPFSASHLFLILLSRSKTKKYWGNAEESAVIVLTLASLFCKTDWCLGVGVKDWRRQPLCLSLKGTVVLENCGERDFSSHVDRRSPRVDWKAGRSKTENVGKSLRFLITCLFGENKSFSLMCDYLGDLKDKC